MPKAPKLLGSLVGLGIAENAVPAGKLADLYGKVEDTETRRQGVAEALLYVKARALSPPHDPVLTLWLSCQACWACSGCRHQALRGYVPAMSLP